jgi:hypothetical protein
MGLGPSDVRMDGDDAAELSEAHAASDIGLPTRGGNKWKAFAIDFGFARQCRRNGTG